MVNLPPNFRLTDSIKAETVPEAVFFIFSFNHTEGRGQTRPDDLVRIASPLLVYDSAGNYITR